MESPANAILILPVASAPAVAAARHGVAASGSNRLRIRQAAPSADAAPSARRHRSPTPIPDPHPDRNTIGQPLSTAHIQSRGRRRLSPPAGISAINSVAKPGRAGQAVCYLNVSARKTLLNLRDLCDLIGRIRAKAA